MNSDIYKNVFFDLLKKNCECYSLIRRSLNKAGYKLNENLIEKCEEAGWSVKHFPVGSRIDAGVL